ncbi:MAG: hypothetical protein ABJD53_17825 [Gammaproteobacteria bacterium]
MNTPDQPALRYGAKPTSGRLCPQKMPSDYSDFLYASIVEEANGMPLTVLSILARADLDPWQEAAQFTNLPRETAEQVLAEIIARQSSGLPTDTDPRMIAERLVALLPGRTTSGARRYKAAASATPSDAVPSVALYPIIYFLVLLSLMGAQWLTSRELGQAPPPAAAAANVVHAVSARPAGP